MKYRPEIDGLRAIAVLPVIFYYADFSIFQGGYVGVDVFFVISGYLITSIILSEIFNSTFSIANFYERRARRILPALPFISSFTLFAAWSHEAYKFSYQELSHSLLKLANENPLVKFIILGGLPQWHPSLPNTMLRAGQLLSNKEDYLKNSRYDHVKNVDKEIEKIVDTLNKENIQFLSLLDLLCKEKTCLSQVRYPKNEPVTFDYAHLTGSGSVSIASLIFSEIDQNNN